MNAKAKLSAAQVADTMLCESRIIDFLDEITDGLMPDAERRALDFAAAEIEDRLAALKEHVE